MREFYKLNEFKEQDIKKAKGYIKKVIIGFITVTIDKKVDEFFNQIGNMRLYPDDEFFFNWKITTIGNDILAAIGCAIVDSKDKEKKELINE